MIQVWSYGGGTQTAAIAGLIITGRLPKPDIVPISDTTREKSSTWRYLEEVVSPALSRVGVKVERIPKTDWMTEEEPDLFTDWGEPGVLIPAFLKKANGEVSRVDGYCSSRWKRRIIQRWLRSRNVDECRVWLGMSIDEMYRVRQSGEAWYHHHYPLIFDVPMRRSECINFVMKEMKWPEPPRSACWMCPNAENPEWLKMKAEAPLDFQRAVEFEREMWKVRPDFFLHRTCIPLDQVDFTNPQTSFLDDGCTSGYCFS